MFARLVTIVVLLCSIPVLLRAEEPVRFFIERIDVEKADRVSPDVIRAESRLRSGHAYYESDLQQANDRINRLPFVVSTRFSLRKGSVRDTYVLVITLNEAKPFFYLVDANFLGSKSDNDSFEEAPVDNSSQFLLGGRFFAGSRNSFHVAAVLENSPPSNSHSLGDDRPNFVAGYTRYDLFGRGAFVTLNLREALLFGGGELLPEVVLGLPLSNRHTLAVEYSTFRDDFFGSAFERRLRTTLTYNSTNEPFFPTRGVILSASPEIRWGDRDSEILEPEATHTRDLALRLRAARYWERSERTSLGVVLEGELNRRKEQRHSENFQTSVSQTEAFGRIDVGLSRSFWSRERREVDGDMRLEVHFRAFLDRSDPFSRKLDNPDQSGQQLTLSWVRRNAWGALRIGAGWAW